jgi:hypothetical protein
MQFGFRMSIAKNQYCTLRTTIYQTQRISAIRTHVCICYVCANTPDTTHRLHLLGVFQHTAYESPLASAQCVPTHRIRIPVGIRCKLRRVCGYSQFGFRMSRTKNQYRYAVQIQDFKNQEPGLLRNLDSGCQEP